jgi:competence protein ComEA
MRNERTFITGLILGICLGIAAAYVLLTLRTRTQPAPIIIMPPGPTAVPAAATTPPPMRVFISGAVAAPDVYDLPPGSILRDAIQQAGGLTAEAASERLNLAQSLADGMHVHIPERNETAVQPPVIQPVIAPAGVGPAAPLPVAGALININTADLATLNSLPGIGPNTAQKIIEYRQSSGLFTTIADIKLVAGIGESKFEQIKHLITIE